MITILKARNEKKDLILLKVTAIKTGYAKGDAKSSQTMADESLKKGIYVIDFFPWYQRIKLI
jgi:hypothetical protein